MSATAAVAKPVVKAKAKPLRLTRPEPSESAVLAAVRRALRVHARVAWFERMNSGAHVAGDGSSRRFVRYGFKGCPDIIGQLTDGRALYIEVKKPSGRVSDEQKAFLARAARFNAVAFVARSVSDVFAVLDAVKGASNGADSHRQA